MSLAVRIIVLAPVLPAVIYFWLSQDIERHRVYRSGNLDRVAAGWEVLLPWAAWPVLVVYGPLVIALAVGVGWAVGRARMKEERRALARREAAANDREREASHLTQEAKQARQLDQTIVANVKRDNVQLSRQADRDNSQFVSAIGELKRRRKREKKVLEQLAAAKREIERLKRTLPPEDEPQ